MFIYVFVADVPLDGEVQQRDGDSGSLQLAGGPVLISAARQTMIIAYLHICTCYAR